MGVYTRRYPVEAPLLIKYGEIIRDLAARGYNWRYYDVNFRNLRQKDPKHILGVQCIESCGLDRRERDLRVNRSQAFELTKVIAGSVIKA